MARMKKEPANSPLSPSLEPVKHLSPRLQRKLSKRVQKQRKRFRSSGMPYPLVSVQSLPLPIGTGKEFNRIFALLLVLAQLD